MKGWIIVVLDTDLKYCILFQFSNVIKRRNVVCVFFVSIKTLSIHIQKQIRLLYVYLAGLCLFRGSDPDPIFLDP